MKPWELNSNAYDEEFGPPTLRKGSSNDMNPDTIRTPDSALDDEFGPDTVDTEFDEFAPDTVRTLPESLDNFELDGQLEGDDAAFDGCCPLCGACDDEECEPNCPNAGDGMTDVSDPDAGWDTRYENFDRPFSQVEPGEGNHPEDCECKSCKLKKESFGFDKFMDRIVLNETKRNIPILVDSPQRIRASKVQERPLGRIRFGVK